jgi:hypothetical protein
MAYPTTGKASFNRVANYVDVVLDTHVNPIYDAVEGITDDLIGSGSGTGLKVSNIVSGGTFVYGTIQSWNGLKARLNNMDAGLFEAYTNRVPSQGSGAISTLLSNIANVPLIVRGAGTTATIPTGAVTVSSGSVTVTTSAAHNFVTGQQVIVAGLTPDGYNGTYTITDTPTTSSFKYVNATTGDITVAGTAVMQQSTNLQEWKKYDGTTATVVASVSGTGNITTTAKFVGTVATIDGGNASSTY